MPAAPLPLKKGIGRKFNKNIMHLPRCAQAFKEQRFPEAVKHYSKALARGPPEANPEAHKLYSNRAACYTKLGAWNDGLKDAEECIRLAPDFAKGYRCAWGRAPSLAP